MRRTFSYLFLWVFFGITLNIAFLSAQIDFHGLRYINTQQGLSQGMVYDILQDSDGFLWIGTKDGLNRYDGYSFKVFTNDPYNLNSISNNSVRKIFEDSRGLLWIATESGGLNVYNKKSGKFHRFNHVPGNPSTISGDKVRLIEEDASGRILVAVDQGELNIFEVGEDVNGSQFEHRLLRKSLPSEFIIRGMKKDGKGRVWIGGNDRCLYRLEQEDFNLTKTKQGYSFTHAALDSVSGHIYGASGSQQLFLWDGEDAYTLMDEALLVLDMAVDREGKIWVAHHEGLFTAQVERRGSSRSDYHLEIIQSWPYLPSISTAADQSGLIWVGTSGHGLIQMNPNQWKFNHLLPGNTVRHIQTLGKKAFLVGRSWSSWHYIDDVQTDTSYISRMFPGEEIDHFILTRSGDVVAMSKSSFIYRRKNGQTQVIPWDREITWDRHLLQEDAQGQIWIAGFDGELRCFKPGIDQFRMFNYEDPDHPLPPESPTTALFIDEDGIFWLGTQSGFAKGFLDQASQRFTFQWYRNDLADRKSLNYNHVSCFMNDPKVPERFLWVGTKGGGLNRLDKKSGEFLHITRNHGLVNNVIYGLLADDNGNIWGSTNKGIFCMIDGDALESIQSPALASISNEVGGTWFFQNFSMSDGLQDDEFNTGAYAKLPDGRLVFGGVNGVNVFSPEDLFTFHNPARVVITSLMVNSKEVEPFDESNILQATIESTRQIVLNHHQNMVTLEFASLDFGSSEQNTYRYQLVGADPDWVNAGNRRTATYIQLPPGQYTFRVQSANSKGIWGDEFTELNIRVLPPWYRTWWAYVIYLLILGLAIKMYISFSLNRAKLQSQLAYETREAERVRDLDLAKTKLYTNITHEFRTPLTIIMGMAQQIKEHPGKHLQTGLDMILRNGQNLLRLVNELLDLSKLESGKMNLDLVNGDLIGFQRYLIESFSSMAETQEKTLHFLPETTTLLAAFDAEKLRQIISNLISNALKFTPEGGHIYVHTGLVNEKGEADPHWFVKVRDTGIGISEEELPVIFDRFYQADSGHTRKAEGSGIGLALTRELVKLMKGEISVQSPPAGQKSGTEFYVVLPVAKIEEHITDLSPKEKFSPFYEAKEIVELPLNHAESSLNSGNSQVPLLLLVEDNADVVAYVAACLQDYRLSVAPNGLEGFEIAVREIPDLIISDVMMPVMDGFEMLKKLREDQRSSHIPVVMLTAKADLDSKLEGIQYGADAYLSKPFHKEELTLRIQKLLEMRKTLQQYFLSSAGLADQEIAHSPPNQEQEVESSFVANVRRVIEERLSDVQLDVESLSREVHLSPRQLQRKLDALTGCSPLVFIRKIRLNQARILLREEDQTIAEISMECGFQDPGYFARVFKQSYGETPAEWRKRSD